MPMFIFRSVLGSPVWPVLLFLVLFGFVTPAAPTVPLARPVFTPSTILVSRLFLPFCPVVPFPTLKDGGYVAELPTPYVGSAWIELASLLLLVFSQIV